MTNERVPPLPSTPRPSLTYLPSETSSEEIIVDTKNVIRTEQRKNGNGICCDCSAKTTFHVNISIGSFICMRCARLLLRLEKPPLIKSINMSSFSSADVAVIQNNGNHVANGNFLGRFNPSKHGQLPTPGIEDTKLKIFLERKYVLRYWHEVQAQAAAALPKFSSAAKKSFHHDNRDDGFLEPESNSKENTYISYEQENFADFTKFESQFSSGGNHTRGHKHKKHLKVRKSSPAKVQTRDGSERKRSDSSSNTLDSVSSGSCSPQRTASTEQVNITPACSTKYDAIAQLDLEMKKQILKDEEKDKGPNVHTTPKNTYKDFTKRPVKPQTSLNIGANTSHTPIITQEQFLRAQYGSPTSTGHALFGVLPQNSPLRSQVQQPTTRVHFKTTHTHTQLPKIDTNLSNVSPPGCVPLRAKTRSLNSPPIHEFTTASTPIKLAAQQNFNTSTSTTNNPSTYNFVNKPKLHNQFSVDNVLPTQKVSGAIKLTQSTQQFNQTNPFLQ